MGGFRFYDEEGILHDHNPNVTTTAYRCSNGHIFETRERHKCPADGCSHNSGGKQGSA
jgi:hypothetical protein